MKITPLDKLFSEFVRRRAVQRVGGCERCLHTKTDITKEDGSTLPDWKQLQCSHFIGRGKGSVRADPSNAAGICGGCHNYFTANPLIHTEWIKSHLGERELDLLRARSYQRGKIDVNGLLLYYRERIKELER